MRGLTVYYCPECGYSGYYLDPENAVCPHCMTAMDTETAEGGRMQQSGRRTAPQPDPQCRLLLHNYQELTLLFNQLKAEHEELQKKYQESEATVQWMHEMIWNLARGLHEKSDG